MFSGIVNAIKAVASAITAGNALQEKQNTSLEELVKQVTRLADLADPNKIVGGAVTHSEPEPKQP